MNRRTFITTTAAASMATALSPSAAAARRPRVLLRNGWQSQNIGDIAHYVGMMELFRRHDIEADVRFWTSNMDHGADDLFRKYFPDVPFFSGGDQVAQAFEECDFLLHGSGSGFVAHGDTRRWHEQTGKPFGVMGISLTGINESIIDTLNQADFVYFRDGVSAARAEEHGVTTAVRGWGPDTAFGVVETRDDDRAEAFLAEHDLEEGRFMCVIPRFRWTPFWEVYEGREFDAGRHARNEERKDPDHAPHREAIISIVRETGMKVLVTHEDQTQIQLGREVLYEPLPDDVRQHVVWRDHFWLPDEALAVYRRSAGLFGNEMHSPIMCIANGIPAVVGRWDEQTDKGFMWRDIGLEDWLFTMDDEERVGQLPATVLAIASDPQAAAAKAAEARAKVLERQRHQFTTLAESLRAAVAG